MSKFRNLVLETIMLHEEDTASDNELIKVFDATKNTPVPVDIKLTKRQFKDEYRGKGQYADGTVFIWVYDPVSKKYLIAQRADDGKWAQSAGGGMIYEDRDFRSAAIRETKEEIGINPTGLKELKVIPRVSNGNIMNWLGIFYCEIPNGEQMKLNLQADEVADVKWLTFEEAANVELINKWVSDSLVSVNDKISKSTTSFDNDIK